MACHHKTSEYLHRAGEFMNSWLYITVGDTAHAQQRHALWALKKGRSFRVHFFYRQDVLMLTQESPRISDDALYKL